MQPSGGCESSLGTHSIEVTAGHKTNNIGYANNSTGRKTLRIAHDDIKRGAAKRDKKPTIFAPKEYQALKALEATHKTYLGFNSTLDYYKHGTVPKSLYILQSDSSKFEPFTVTSQGYTFYLYLDRYNKLTDEYTNTKATVIKNKLVPTFKTTDTSSTTTTTSSMSDSVSIDLYPDIPPGFETSDEIVDFSVSPLSESPMTLKQSDTAHDHVKVSFPKSNKSYEKSFKPNFTKIAQDYNNNNDTVINFETKEEAKALKILRDNDALAIEPPSKPPSIDNTPLSPYGFEYEPLNGTVFRKRTLFDASLRATQVALVILFFILICTLDYFYLNAIADFRPLYIILLLAFSHIVAHISYLHYPLLATPSWYHDYSESYVPQSLTHVKVEYIKPSAIPAAHSENPGSDSRPVMTRAGKIDHSDPQIWDVVLTESYLLQDTSFKGRLRQALLGRIRYYTRLKIMNIKVSLELLTNIMALKTLNRDDPIDVLRVKIKQSMGNINCINIPRFFSIQNEFIQSNTLDIALHQLRSLREGQDFQLSL